MTVVTRRRFIAAALATASAAPVPAFAATTPRRRVIVVGAGLAGLHAAMLLEHAGLEVRVVEGRDRVGGRILTLDDLPGRPEAGGNVIGPNYGRILSTAGRLGLDLQPPQRPLPADFSIRGERIARDVWPTSESNPLRGELRQLTPDVLSSRLLQDHPFTAASDWRSPAMQSLDVAASDYFRSAGLDDDAIALIDANNSYGNSLAETSLLSLYRVVANISRAIEMGRPALEVDGGNLRLPEAMAASLASQVTLGERIDAVSLSDGFVRVTSAGGRRFDADAAILAVPATALRNVRFEPDLPAEQSRAIAEIRYHKVTQAHLVADTDFWTSDNLAGSCWTDGPLGRVFTTKVSDGGPWSINCWINGDDCDRFDGIPDDEAGASILREFHRLYPGSRHQVAFHRLIRWQAQSLSGGSWAIWRPGDIARYTDLLHRPAGRVFFAGEHTSFSNPGMEGAAESGERAALDVMRALA